MDPLWIGGLIGSLGVAASGVLTAYAVVRKAMAPEAEARRWVQTVIDLVAAGVVHGLPHSVLARGRRIVEEKDRDSEASTEG